MRAGQRRPLLSVFGAMVLALGATAMVVQSVGAFGLFEALVVRTVARTVGVDVQRDKDIRAVNVRRDQRLENLVAEEATIDFKAQRGWLTPEQVAAERERVRQRREAIKAVAKRERQIVNYQARNRIRSTLRNSLRDGIAAATGANARVVDLLTDLVRGENPLVALGRAAINERSLDPREDFRQLAEQLAEVKSAATALGGAQTIDLRARLDDAYREALGLAESDAPPPDDKIQHLGELLDGAGRLTGGVQGALDELFPGGPGIGWERFKHDARWLSLNGDVDYFGESRVKQATSSMILRRSAERAAELAASQGISLDEALIDAVALGALARWVDRKSDGDGEVYLDELVSEALDVVIAAKAGIDPSDAETEAEPVRRRFMGQGTFDHDYNHRSGAQCSVTVTVDHDLVLEADGTAILVLSDTPMHVVSDEGDVSCVGAGLGQTYSGTWDPSESDTLAQIPFGSREELIFVEISGDMPEGSASAAFVFPEHRVYGSYQLDFELSEVE